MYKLYISVSLLLPSLPLSLHPLPPPSLPPPLPPSLPPSLPLLLLLLLLPLFSLFPSLPLSPSSPSPSSPSSSCLWFYIEPLITRSDNFQFLCKMIDSMKQMVDAECPNDDESNKV